MQKTYEVSSINSLTDGYESEKVDTEIGILLSEGWEFAGEINYRFWFRRLLVAERDRRRADDNG